MTLNGFSVAILSALKVPSLAAATVIAIVWVGTAFGFGITTPGSNLDQINDRLTHIEQELLAEKQQDEEFKLIVDALFRGHCIEWTKETIELSGLAAKCRSLGIEK